MSELTELEKKVIDTHAYSYATGYFKTMNKLERLEKAVVDAAPAYADAADAYAVAEAAFIKVRKELKDYLKEQDND
tara:strand:+ start:1877 stop:2104 length:228 start_codon:yes stop_codon:yes gene_type:complete